MCSYDLEPAEFWNETTPRARKPYVCDECCRLISVGTQHVKIDAKWDGTLHTMRVHSECYALGKRLDEIMCGPDSEGWTVGMMLDHLREAGVQETRSPNGYDDVWFNDHPLSPEHDAEVRAAWTVIASFPEARK